MFELTPEQRQELGGTEPAHALDPDTSKSTCWFEPMSMSA